MELGQHRPQSDPARLSMAPVSPASTPVERWQLAYQAVASVCLYWSNDYLPIADWACAARRAPRELIPKACAWVLADLALLRGDADLLQAVLAGLDNGWAAGDARGDAGLDGQWAAGQAAFEAALKQRKARDRRHQALPAADSIAWFYPLSLLAQATPRHLELARKFCAGESGRREPPLQRLGTLGACHRRSPRQGALVGSAFRRRPNAALRCTGARLAVGDPARRLAG
jgi:hypothetical protein